MNKVEYLIMCNQISSNSFRNKITYKPTNQPTNAGLLC